MRHSGANLAGDSNSLGAVAPALPPGTPPWITPELVAATLDCWQPHFPKALTTEDAVEIITNVGRLLDAMGLTMSFVDTTHSPAQSE